MSETEVLNRYGQKWGVTGSEETLRYVNAIKEATSVEWQDHSWHNEETDSMSWEFKEGCFLKVWLPDSRREEPNLRMFSICVENLNALWVNEETVYHDEGTGQLIEDLDTCIEIVKHYINLIKYIQI